MDKFDVWGIHSMKLEQGTMWLIVMGKQKNNSLSRNSTNFFLSIYQANKVNFAQICLAQG